MSLEARLVIGPYRATMKPHLEGGGVHFESLHNRIINIFCKKILKTIDFRGEYSIIILIYHGGFCSRQHPDKNLP